MVLLIGYLHSTIFQKNIYAKNNYTYHFFSVKDSVPESDTTSPIIGKDTLLLLDSTTLNTQKNSYDKITTWDGKTYIVRITNNKDDNICFKYPLNQNIEKISLNKISKIKYSGGKTEIFEKVDVNQDYDLSWEDIKIVNDVAEVEGMEKIDEVYAKFESKKPKVKNEYLIKYGYSVIQKKATNQYARVVLITNEKIYKAYGDLPYIEIWGEIYK